ncbi:MAG: cupin domain-containing protein [Hyphomicrobiaceae bacterium]
MLSFNLHAEQEFSAAKHVEKILGTLAGGDFTVACWEPGQVSPNHCHPEATEIYFCLEGGGKMKTPSETIEVGPGAFVVHPPGEVHEYTNGGQRTLLFRVRYGDDVVSRTLNWPSNPNFQQSPEDIDYYKKNPV